MSKHHEPRRMARHTHVNLDQRADVLYWTGMWGLSDQELHDAVRAVGPLATDVAAHLGRQVVDIFTRRGRQPVGNTGTSY